MGVVIDTSAFVALERRGAELSESLASSVGSDEVFVPALVLAELWIGVEMAESATRRASRVRKIEALLAGTTTLAFDERVAPTYARLWAALRRLGTPIPANDLAIASLAIHFGLGILVGPDDEAHFRRIPQLSVHVLAS